MLVELRDAIAIARAEDVPPLVEHMTRLQALAAQRGAGEEKARVNPACPYFGHLRLDEDGAERDVLLGKATYLAPEHGIRIVDWRNAPVSRMYYRYDQGDDYEETFGGRARRGVITSRRSVTITRGELVRVACQDGTFVRRRGAWERLAGDGPRLSGGQGVSIRAEGLTPVRGRLGVGPDGEERVDRHLPEVSGLLDRAQFEVISSPASGLVVVQGSAGSGKTTVGLHRIAYLAFQEPRRFRPARMLVAVFNDALATYVSGVLPALGVNGVKVTTFARWAASQRRRHVRGLPKGYSEWTPSAVSRLKKHPAMLRMLDDVVDRRDEELTAQLRAAVAGTPDGERVSRAWKILERTPLDARRVALIAWLNGERRIGDDDGVRLHPRTALAADGALTRMARVTEDVLDDWAELLTNRAALGAAVATHAPAEFEERELDEVCRWCAAIYSRIEDERQAAEDDELPAERDDAEDGPAEREEAAVLDREDDAILVRLHQLKRGPLRGPGGRLELDHLMVDEVQDFSALEVAVMMEAVGHGRPVTLAGDTAQRIGREGGFDDWDELLADLGVEGARVEPLKIAYRSTAEVMRVAQEVLGPFAGEEPVATRHGAEVEAHRFSEAGQAVDFVSGALRELAAREPLANVAVVARHPGHAKLYHQGLATAEVPRLRLVAEQDFSFAPGVEVTDVRQVKGLEFDYVILVDVNADTYPDNEEARHLLHVGVTRAAHQLWIVCTGDPSPLIPNRLLADE
jgi:DNA helicase-2/ATP-dependent DNA helicase PcrA